MSLLLTQTRELILSEQKQKKSNVVIEYNLPNTDVYLPSGTVLSTVVDGEVFEINIEKNRKQKNANCPLK